MVKISHKLFHDFKQLNEYKGLTKLQKKFFKDFFSGRNLFLTGPAGTGKSFCVNLLIKFLDSNGIFYGKTATTGVAALNIGGVTLHSWSGMGLAEDNGMELLDKVKENPKAVQRIKNSKVLIIDEISMAKSDLVEKLDIVCQYIRSKDRPFGGIQTIFVGDFCLKNGTKIVMGDGSLRKIEDVNVGEKVMGPDSLPRTVLRKFSGEAPMYEVSQTNGINYTVTENHLIALKRRGNSERHLKFKDAVYLKPLELLNCSGKFKEIFGGYKAGCLTFPERKLLLDPYFVGAWLGDGHKDSSRITTADFEIVEYCKSYAKKMGLVCDVYPEHAGKDTPALRVSIHSKSPKSGSSKVVNGLKYYNIFNDKHIPSDYLLNSEGNRLLLLAGLLDTDGCWSGNRFVYASSLENLASQVKQLSDHLGFRTNLRRVEQTNSWEVTIGGDTWRIPTIIKRKKSKVRNLGRSRLNSTLVVTPKPVGKFSGIEIDGDNLFLLEDGTVLHNCQLPPVFKNFDEEKFAFESQAWKDAKIKTSHLTEIVRQHDEPQFAKLLNEIRMGTAENYTLLMDCVNRKFPDDGIKPVKLSCKNVDVSRQNHEELRKIKTESKYYYAADSGGENWRQFFDKNCQAPTTLELKEGAQVMLLANLDTEAGLVNGSMGKVLKCYDNYVDVQFACGPQIIETHKWEVKQNEFDSLTGKMKKVVLASRAQIPLKLAYSISIHKSQGQTLDRVEVDISEAFACGQVYTALSRVKNSKSLSIKAFSPHKIKVNKKCFDFYNSQNEEKDVDFFEDEE